MANVKKKKGTLRYIILAAVFIVVLLIVALVILNSGIDLGEAVKDLRGKATDTFYYEGAAAGGAVPVGDSLAVVNASGLTLYDRRGEESWNVRLSFSEPRFALADGYAAAWEFGGRNVFLLNEDGLVHRVTAEGELISVTVNDRGYACLATRETGYGGVVTVYNPNGLALYRWYSGTGYVLTARLRENNDLMIVSLEATGSVITLVRITEEEARAETRLTGIAIDASFNDNGIAVVLTDRVVFLNFGLETRGTYEYGGRHVTDYAFGANYAALALGEYQIGGDRTLVTVGTDGTELGSYVIREELHSISLMGESVAAFSTGRVRVFSRRLDLEAEFPAPAGCEQIYMRKYNSVIAAGSYSAAVLTVEEEETK